MKANVPQLSVLLEGPCGVMEVHVAAMQLNDHVAFFPVSATPRSGKPWTPNRGQIRDALKLLRWAEDHVRVFSGRVSPKTGLQN